MLRTLFHIPVPLTLFGIPVLGLGLFLAAWGVAGIALFAIRLRRHGAYQGLPTDVALYAMMGSGIAFLLPKMLEPEGLPIRGYGAMLLAGVLSGIAMACWRARRVGLNPDLILSLALWMFLAGIVGARLFYVIEYWEEQFKSDSLVETLGRIARVTEGGLVVFGALLAVLPTMAAFARARKIPVLALADLAAPSMALGLALGRVGCFLNGCCFGGPTDLAWGVCFPQGSPPHERQVREQRVFLHGLKLIADDKLRPVVAEVEPDSPADAAGIRAGDAIVAINDQEAPTVREAFGLLLGVVAPDDEVKVAVERGPRRPPLVFAWRLASRETSLPVQPAQLYSALDAALLCLFLLAVYPYRRRDGEGVAWMLTLHPISRFLLEIVRTDEGSVFQTGLSISQNISILMLAAAIILWAWLRRRPKGLAWPRPDPGNMNSSLDAAQDKSHDRRP